MDPLENTEIPTPSNDDEQEKDLLQQLIEEKQQAAEAQAQQEQTPIIEETEESDVPVSAGWQASVDAAKERKAQDKGNPRSAEADAQRVAGKGGDERNPFDALVATGVDLIDNAFQGNQESYDEIRDRMAANRAAKTEEDANAPALQRALAEPGRAVTGSFLGATESALEFSEIVGDVSKTLASKINLVGYDPQDDPFSDKYNWVNWNLGSDDLGAQTGVGKITQGFGEFAVTFSALGGGKAVSGLFKGGTTTGKAVLGAMSREALEGVGADMVMAASGEGNLSNLIKQYAPDWYPTWLTALSIDEDDNPFEAAFKTALEGGMLGAPIGAVTAFFRGHRASKAFKKANPNATPRELNQVAIDAANESLANPPSPTTPKYKDITFKPEEIDTRGNEVYFHGAAAPFEIVEDGQYSGGSNIYGNGFYATDDAVTAASYRKKNAKKGEPPQGVVYRVGPLAETKFYDLDQPADGAILDHINTYYFERDHFYADLIEVSLQDAGEGASLGRIIDEMRANSRNYNAPDYEVIELIEDFKDVLRQEGYGGFTHVGGNKAGKGKRNHQVRIYWEPAEQLSITPVDVPAPRSTFDEAALSTIQQMERVGIDPTWDDVAAVTPQYFTPGSRQIEAPEFGYDALEKIVQMDPTNPDGAVFVNPFTGETPTTGTMVSIDGAVLEALDDYKAVEGFIGKYYDILTRDDAFLKATLSQTTGKPQVEISRLVNDADDAIQLGRLFDQENVFRLDDLKIEKTGGFDQLKRSQGDHLKSISSRAVKSTTVEPQKAALQGLQADLQLNPRGGAQNMLTDNMVVRLGQAGPARTDELIKEINDASSIDISELATQAQLTPDQVIQNAMVKLGDDFGYTASEVSKLDFDNEFELSREGTVQVGHVMKELGARLSRSVFKANDASKKGLNNLEHVQSMVDDLKAFMKVYKISSNSISKKLSAPQIEIPKDFSLTPEQLNNRLVNNKPSSDGIAEELDRVNKYLDRMVEGLKGNDPKARNKSLRIGAQLELLGDKPYQLAQGIATLPEIGTKYGLKIMYNSMLSAPATHIINTTSNAIAVILRPLAASVGGDARARKAAAASRYLWEETLSDAFRMARDKWKETNTTVKGVDTSSGQANIVLDELETRAYESKDRAFQAGVFIMRGFQAIAEMPGMGLPSRLLTTSDEFFKVAIQRMEYKRMIMEKAIDLHGNDANLVWKELYEAEKRINFTKSGEALDEELIRIAKDVTFQTDLEGVAKRFGDLVNSYPVLRVFFPFVRTAHNVTVYTASYVPVLAQAMERLSPTKVADLPPYEQAILKGRQYIGTFFIAGAGMLAANGMLVGNGPMGDKKARDKWLESNQPRSLKFGNTFISLDRLEPFGPILASVADVVYALKNGQMEENRAAWMIGYLGQAVGVNVTDRTFFQGLRDFSAVLYPGNKRPEFLLNLAAKNVNNFIPAASLRRAMVSAWTPYQQEFDSEMDRFLYSTGLFSFLSNRATKRDFLTGEPIESLNSGINSLLPIKINNLKQDPVRQAMFKIDFNTDKIVEELGESGVKLSSEHLSRMAELMGNSDLYKELLAIVKRPDWNRAVDAYIKSGGKRTPESPFVGKKNQLFYIEFNRTVGRFAQAALGQLQQEYPELREELDAYIQAKNQDRYGGLTDYYQQ